jgi:hypothetical protein
VSDKAQVTYTLNGVTKSFEVSMDRFDELLAWAGRTFSDARDIGGPDLIHSHSTTPNLALTKRNRKA